MSEAQQRSPKDWTVLIYMKPDAALEQAALDDLREMKEVPGTDRINLVVQIDRANDVERLLITNGDEKPLATPRPRPRLLEDTLAGFLRDGLAGFPSKHRLVVIWGHTRGVGFDLVGPREDSPDVPFPGNVAESAGLAVTNGRLASAAQNVTQSVPPIALPRPGKLGDGLTVSQLAGVLDRVTHHNGRQTRIDLLGLDSCYMSGVEFTYELRNAVDRLVASQSPIRTRGWNYKKVLSFLTGSDSYVTPSRLGKAIVQHITTLKGPTNLSLLDLHQAEDFKQAMRRLVWELSEVARHEDDLKALKIFLERTSYLKVRQFLDLRDLCHRLRAGFDGDPVANAAEAVLDLLYVRSQADPPPRSLIEYHEARDAALGRLNGLSIYYPHVQVRTSSLPAVEQDDANAVVDLDEYRNLGFPKDTGWNALIERLGPEAG